MTIIDVSRHNGAIDWPRARAEGGVECAIIRATLGSTGVDERYAENWRESGWAGVPRRGVYHYVIAGVSAAAQVHNILAATGGDFGTEPVTLDVERTRAQVQAMKAGWQFPVAAYTAMLFELAHALRMHTPVRLYTSKWEWLAMTTEPAWAANFPLWVAGYPTDPESPTYKPAVPSPWADWSIWQYSSTGRVPGLAGDVDLSRERAAAPDTLAADVASHARAILGVI